METLLEPVGIREAKNRFSEITAIVNDTGRPLTVRKNGHPWVIIQPADPSAALRRQKLEKLKTLTALIEQDLDIEPVWDLNVSDKELLGEERVSRFV